MMIDQMMIRSARTLLRGLIKLQSQNSFEGDQVLTFCMLSESHSNELERSNGTSLSRRVRFYKGSTVRVSFGHHQSSGCGRSTASGT